MTSRHGSRSPIRRSAMNTARWPACSAPCRKRRSECLPNARCASSTRRSNGGGGGGAPPRRAPPPPGEAPAERRLLASLVEATGAFVHVIDLEYRWLAINRAAADEFERIFGIRPK